MTGPLWSVLLSDVLKWSQTFPKKKKICNFSQSSCAFLLVAWHNNFPWGLKSQSDWAEPTEIKSNISTLLVQIDFSLRLFNNDNNLRAHASSLYVVKRPHLFRLFELRPPAAVMTHCNCKPDIFRSVWLHHWYHNHVQGKRQARLSSNVGQTPWMCLFHLCLCTWC